MASYKERKMTVSIDKKIIGFEVKKQGEEVAVAVESQQAQPDEMHESIERPEMLLGSTYKVKTPMSEHAFYVTINDYLLNEGTEYEQRRPYEIFINSKNMEHFQWIVALTRVISAVFRKGGDSTFLVEELKSVFDPQGGYFKPGGRFMPSIIAELGCVIESHMKSIGMIKDDLDEHQQRLIFEKKKQLAEASANNSGTTQSTDYPAQATMCKKCQTKAVVIMDGCATCLNCGDSKCG